MIFVAVGEHDAANMLAVLHQIRNVGDYDIDAEQFGFGEHEAAVDDNNVVSPADGHAVHTELAKAPERNNLQFSSGHEVTHDASTVCVPHRTLLGNGVPFYGARLIVISTEIG